MVNFCITIRFFVHFTSHLHINVWLPCFRVNHVIMVKHHRPWSKQVRQSLVVSDHVWQWKIATGPEPFFQDHVLDMFHGQIS